MKTKQPLVSVIIPAKNASDLFISETVPALLKQTYRNFEVLFLPDHPLSGKIPGIRVVPTFPKIGPADKRDIGVKAAKGSIVAFIDDDAYPDRDWLKYAVPLLMPGEIAAVCGPGITPPSDNLMNQISGWFWASRLGSGGAGTYRCWPMKIREIDDYPAFNLIVKKDDYTNAGGFSTLFWPGDDTKLCYSIVYKTGKKIFYNPKILVYHHRRPLLIPHLKQLGRYGLHRGHFVRILPETSKRLGYFGPAIFTLGVVGGVVLQILLRLVNSNIIFRLEEIFIVFLFLYLIANIINSGWVFGKSRNLAVALILIPTTFISHLFYGTMFIKGLTARGLTSKYDRSKI